MTQPPTADSWLDRVRGVGLILKRGFREFLAFEIFFRLLAAVLFTPITAWLTSQLIAWSGSGAVSNYDLAGFFLSFKGLAYLTVVVTIGFALFFFEFGGLTALAIALQRERRVKLLQLIRFLSLSLPRLWRLSVRQFAVYLLAALPCLAIAGGAYLLFLTKSDINYYLHAKPPAFWWAASLAGVAGLLFAAVALRFFIDWILSVPLLLFTDRSPAAAMRESRSLVTGRRMSVLMMLLRWFAFVTVLLFAVAVAIVVLKALFLRLAGDRVPLVLMVTAVLAVLNFLALILVSIASQATLATAVARRFIALRPEVRLPEILIGSDSAVLRWAKRVFGAGWIGVLVFGVVTTLVAVGLLNRIQFVEEVGVTAHRGSSITAPENTIAAILLAIDEGADFIEIDVQETRDGTVVLAHDKDLKRVFGIEKGIWEVTYDELKDLDSGGWFSPEFADQRIATLAQVIEAVNGRAKLNIELKFNGHHQKLASEVVRIVKGHRFLDQCILTSLDYDGIRRAEAADPRARTGVIVTSAIGDITRLETDLLSVNADSVTRDLLSRAHRHGLDVHVWTVNDVPLMNSMAGMGVDHIITDNPRLLREVLDHRAELTNAQRALLQLADIANHRF